MTMTTLIKDGSNNLSVMWPKRMSEGAVAARADTGHLLTGCSATGVGSAPTPLDTVEQQCVDADMFS